MLIVVKTFHGRLVSSYTFGLHTMVRNLTNVLCVRKDLVRASPFAPTFGLYTMTRSPTSVLCAVEGLVREVPLPVTSGVYTTERSGTRVLIAVKLLPVRRVCRDI